MSPRTEAPDPRLDLVLERTVDIPPRLVWEAWTRPEHLVHWFAPKPWTCSRAEVELYPGGTFLTVMCSPEGQEMGEPGCILEVVPERSLVWTDALAPGFRPKDKSFMTARITLIPEGDGTRYIATAMHADADQAKQHQEMGFFEGWGTCLEQLVAYMKEAGPKA